MSIDAAQLLYELRVHQIELEMQNEELRRAQLETEEQRAKYHELFDLAPVGYLTLSEKDVVDEANFTAAHLLGVERRELVGRPFSPFVLAADQEVYYLHRRLLEKTGERQSCELRLQRPGAGMGGAAEAGAGAVSGRFWAHLESWPQRAASGETVSLRTTFSDSTARKQAEEALRLRNEETACQQEFLATLLDAIPSPIFYKDATGVYLGCNRAFERFLGRDRGEIIGKRAAALGSPEITERYEAEDRHLLEQRGTQTYEWPVKAADGSLRDVVFNKATFNGSDGQVAGLIGVILDITARKRAEQALQESEENYRDFFDTVDDIIVVATPDGRLVYVNPAASARLGYGAADIAGMQMLDLYPAESRGEAAAVFAGMSRGEHESCSLPLQDISGAPVLVETRVWLGCWDGDECVFAVSKDVTEEQEARQRFERLFRSNPALTAVSSLPEGRFTEVNDAFLNALGYAREEVLGRTPEELDLFVDPEQQRAVAGQLQEQGHISALELKVRRKDGAILDGHFSGEVIEGQGRPYLLTVMIDQTERKRAE
jgi:PAS domain S-box-containing protein